MLGLSWVYLGKELPEKQNPAKSLGFFNKIGSRNLSETDPAKSLGFFNKIGSRSLSETAFLEVFLLYGPAEKPS